MTDLRDEAKAQYVGAMFARIAGRYDRMNRLMTLGRDAVWRRMAVEMAAPPEGGTALDVATGTGELAIALARYRRLRRVVGLDFCSTMLERAAAKVSALGMADVLDFQEGDALALPFPDDAFDCATTGFALRNVADISRALSEMRRVVRPGARVVCLELTRPSSPIVGSFFRTYFYGLVPILGRMVTGDTEAYRYLPRSLTNFPNADRLAAMMERVGLQEVRYRLLGLGTVAIHMGRK